MAFDFTPAQKQATETIDQNLQIIAAAGSGKTRVVAGRVIHILKERADITPENIVVVTFARRAAAEVKDRIGGLYEETFGHRRELSGLFVGTYHTFCLELLRAHLPEWLHVEPLDEVGQRLFIDKYSHQSGLKGLGLIRYRDSGRYAAILRILRESRTNRDLLRDHPVQKALGQYRALLRKHALSDYDEIIYRTVQELQRNEAMRRQVAQQIKFVVVDEFQDSAPIQSQLLDLLHELGANLCVVGDHNQAIYHWRGGDPAILSGFAQRYPDVAQVALAVNYRSSPAITAVARQVVAHLPENAAASMSSAGRQTFERGDLLALQFASPHTEAEWIADKIARMRGLPFQEAPEAEARGLSWSDCAILLRSARHCAGPIVAALKARDIPCIITGTAGLFGTAEAKAAGGVFAYLAVEAGQQEAAALKSLWRDAALGLTDADLERGIAMLKERRADAARAEESDRASAKAAGAQGAREAEQMRLAHLDFHNLQRVFLDFLTAIGMREERVPDDRGSLVYYNLGKFSQVISDYLHIHFLTGAAEQYRRFAAFLEHQAPGLYPEGGQDAAFSIPDAVRISTIHAVKGMEFPVVFLPCLQRNRFPTRRFHERMWDTLPKAAIIGAERYETTEADERRLLYVGLTRAEKYLFASYAPDADNDDYRKPSLFFNELTQCDYFLTKEPAPAAPPMLLPPQPRRLLEKVIITFSDLGYLLRCPRMFRLRCLYGFNPPVNPRMGYGTSVHNALAEIHRRSREGEHFEADQIEALVEGLLDRHLHARYATPFLRAQLERATRRDLTRYLRDHGARLQQIEHTELVVDVTFEGAVQVSGRIDLIRRTDTGEQVIADFKTKDRAPSEQVPTEQLNVYAIGYEQRTGRRADMVEIFNVSGGGSEREVVDAALLAETTRKVREAGDRLRRDDLPRLPIWCQTCEACDMNGICRNRSDAPPADAE